MEDTLTERVGLALLECTAKGDTNVLEMRDAVLAALGLDEDGKLKNFIEWAATFEGHTYSPLRAVGQEAADILASFAREGPQDG